jgi:hypothetical protein
MDLSVHTDDLVLQNDPIPGEHRCLLMHETQDSHTSLKEFGQLLLDRRQEGRARVLNRRSLSWSWLLDLLLAQFLALGQNLNKSSVPVGG